MHIAREQLRGCDHDRDMTLSLSYDSWQSGEGPYRLGVNPEAVISSRLPDLTLNANLLPL